MPSKSFNLLELKISTADGPEAASAACLINTPAARQDTDLHLNLDTRVITRRAIATVGPAPRGNECQGFRAHGISYWLTTMLSAIRRLARRAVRRVALGVKLRAGGTWDGGDEVRRCKCGRCTLTFNSSSRKRNGGPQPAQGTKLCPVPPRYHNSLPLWGVCHALEHRCHLTAPSHFPFPLSALDPWAHSLDLF